MGQLSPLKLDVSVGHFIAGGEIAVSLHARAGTSLDVSP